MWALFPLEAKVSKDDYLELGKPQLQMAHKNPNYSFMKTEEEKKNPVFLFVSSYPVNTNHPLLKLCIWRLDAPIRSFISVLQFLSA